MSSFTGIPPEEFTRAKADLDAGRNVSEVEADGEYRDGVEQAETGWLPRWVSRFCDWFFQRS